MYPAGHACNYVTTFTCLVKVRTSIGLKTLAPSGLCVSNNRLKRSAHSAPLELELMRMSVLMLMLMLLMVMMTMMMMTMMMMNGNYT